MQTFEKSIMVKAIPIGKEFAVTSLAFIVYSMRKGKDQRMGREEWEVFGSYLDLLLI